MTLEQAARQALTDDELRKMWRAWGGNFHGPNVETGTMPEAKLLPFLRSIASTPPAKAQGEPLMGHEAAMSWDGKNVYGNAESIKAVRNAVESYSSLLVEYRAVRADVDRLTAQAEQAGQAVAWRQGGIAPVDGYYWIEREHNPILGVHIESLTESYPFADTTKWAGPIPAPLPSVQAKPPEQWLWRVFNLGWPRGHEAGTNTWGDWQLISDADATRLAADDENSVYEFVPYRPKAPQ